MEPWSRSTGKDVRGSNEHVCGSPDSWGPVSETSRDLDPETLRQSQGSGGMARWGDGSGPEQCEGLTGLYSHPTGICTKVISGDCWNCPQ